MICHIPFFVGAGDLSAPQLNGCGLALHQYWGGLLLKYESSEDPNKIIESLPEQKGLVQLIGDPAKISSKGVSWLEALGAWQQPTVLISNTFSNEIPGTAFAYTALCRSFSIPLLGVIQYGGDWDPYLRKLDGLPWCGWIPERTQEGMFQKELTSDIDERLEVVFKIRERLDLINFHD